MGKGARSRGDSKKHGAVEQRSVEGEAAKFVSVGDQVDCRDSAVSKREPGDGERSVRGSDDQSGGAVDESHSRLWCEPGAAGEKLSRDVGGACGQV
jgi:hypothetical protein